MVPILIQITLIMLLIWVDVVSTIVIDGGRKFWGGANINICARSTCEIFKDMPPLIEIQRSLVAIGGAATVRNKEMVENVHCDRFLKLF